jgi:hypothetical protein
MKGKSKLPNRSSANGAKRLVGSEWCVRWKNRWLQSQSELTNEQGDISTS